MVKLSACEKLLRVIPQEEQLRITYVHFLLLSFF